MNNPFSTKTTEVSVTSEIVTTTTQEPIDLAPLGAAQHRNSVVGQQPPSAYSVTISAVPSGSAGQKTTTRTNGNNENSCNSNNSNNNNAAQPRIRRKAAYEANSAAWQYTKCAILFFTAILVTWIPSTANRVYSVVHKNEISLPLEYMSAFVLPLQGFWNAIIYVVTSWGACRRLAEDVGVSFSSFTSSSQGSAERPAGLEGRGRRSRGRMAGDVGSGEDGGAGERRGAFEMMGMGRGRNVRKPASDKSSGTESMEELAQVHCSAPRGDEP